MRAPSFAENLSAVGVFQRRRFPTHDGRAGRLVGADRRLGLAGDISQPSERDLHYWPRRFARCSRIARLSSWISASTLDMKGKRLHVSTRLLEYAAAFR